MKTIIYLALALALPFAAKAQLQNTGFEDWVIPVAENQMFQNRPVGWHIDNGRGLGPVNAYYPAASDAYSGDYALTIGIWYNYIKDMAVQTAPISSRPDSLTGQYKYGNQLLRTNSGQMYDQASVRVYLTKWNDALSVTDTIGSGEVFLNGSFYYSEFSCPITYTSDEVPDSITVILDPSLMDHEGFDGGEAEEGEGSILTVDNIALIEPEFSGRLGNKSHQQKDFVIFPNPVTNVLSFKDYKGAVKVYDATGKLVFSQPEYVNNISVSNLKTGIYYLELNDGNTIMHNQFIKQ